MVSEREITQTFKFLLGAALFGTAAAYCLFWAFVWLVISLPFAFGFHNPMISAWMSGIGFSLAALVMLWGLFSPLRDSAST